MSLTDLAQGPVFPLVGLVEKGALMESFGVTDSCSGRLKLLAVTVAVNAW